MRLTPLQKRAARKARNGPLVDLNLVSLIDVFTILIFFLLSNSTDVETLPVSGAVHLPESSAQKTPRSTLVVAVNATDISVDGRVVAQVADFAAAQDDLIAPLKAALEQDAARGAPTAAPAPTPATASGPDALRHGAVTILGDKDIPYQLLRKVMYTCAAANFADVSFAVNRRA